MCCIVAICSAWRDLVNILFSAQEIYSVSRNRVAIKICVRFCQSCCCFNLSDKHLLITTSKLKTAGLLVYRKLQKCIAEAQAECNRGTNTQRSECFLTPVSEFRGFTQKNGCATWAYTSMRRRSWSRCVILTWSCTPSFLPVNAISLLHVERIFFLNLLLTFNSTTQCQHASGPAVSLVLCYVWKSIFLLLWQYITFIMHKVCKFSVCSMDELRHILQDMKYIKVCYAYIQLAHLIYAKFMNIAKIICK